MRRLFAQALVGALLSSFVLMAGCAEDPGGVEGGPKSAASRGTSGPVEPAPEPIANDTAGAIAGRVLDDEQLPLTGTRVTLVEGLQETRADDEGRFTFNGLEAAR